MVLELRRKLTSLDGLSDAKRLSQLADYLVDKSVWIIGGDGWAYDIGYGGLDHVLASGANVKVLVLDTEVYSNTGGQQSKATPVGAAAKFAAAGKSSPKKDLGLLAMAYGNIYVAQVAFGAKDVHTVRAFQEAASYPGPALIIAYSHCIAHGYDMVLGPDQQKLAVASGYWPLYRYDPRRRDAGQSPLQVDSGQPNNQLQQFMANETRFRMVEQKNPDRYKALLTIAKRQVADRFFALSTTGRISRGAGQGHCVLASNRKGAIMNLTTTYMGLELANPLMSGASPLADDLDTARRLEDAGASAIVMRSLFEEQVEGEHLASIEQFELHANAFSEASSFFPGAEEFSMGPDAYLEQIRRLKTAVNVPVIASLNGLSISGWLRYAELIEQAGADALELNVYHVATQARETPVSIEHRIREVARCVREAVHLPVAVKLSPFLTSLPHMAMELRTTGIDGLVLFNRFYQPDIDVEDVSVVPQLHLSDSSELLLRLRWLAILSGRCTAVAGGQRRNSHRDRCDQGDYGGRSYRADCVRSAAPRPGISEGFVGRGDIVDGRPRI